MTRGAIGGATLEANCKQDTWLATRKDEHDNLGVLIKGNLTNSK
jgi:hypothetical protein